MSAAAPEGKVIATCKRPFLRIYLFFWQAHHRIPWPGRGGDASPTISPHQLAEHVSYTIWRYWRGLLDQYRASETPSSIPGQPASSLPTSNSPVAWVMALADFADQVPSKQTFSRGLRQEIGHTAMLAVRYEASAPVSPKADLPEPAGGWREGVDYVVLSHTGGNPGLETLHGLSLTRLPTLARLNMHDTLTQDVHGGYDTFESLRWRLQNKECARVKVIDREDAGSVKFARLQGIRNNVARPGEKPPELTYFAPSRYGLNVESTWTGEEPSLLDEAVGALERLFEEDSSTSGTEASCHGKADIKGGCGNNTVSILKALGLASEIPAGAEFIFGFDEHAYTGPLSKDPAEGSRKSVPIYLASDAFGNFGKDVTEQHDFTLDPALATEKDWSILSRDPMVWSGPTKVRFHDPTWLYFACRNDPNAFVLNEAEPAYTFINMKLVNATGGIPIAKRPSTTH